MDNTLNESQAWHKKKIVEKTLKSLEKNNISGCYVETLKAACNRALSLIPKGSKVGYGGSMTLDQIGIKEILRRGNCNFIDRELPEINENDQNRLRRESLFSDVFLMSTNALTMEGHLVNIDGFGNLITNIKDDDLPQAREAITVEVGNKLISGLSCTYVEGKELLALIGSSGYLEVSLKGGSACAFLNAEVGDEVKIKKINQ